MAEWHSKELWPLDHSEIIVECGKDPSKGLWSVHRIEIRVGYDTWPLCNSSFGPLLSCGTI